ncbi:TetR/AcrR family transcriptional regulator [Paenibacillus flagellatus]|uniref:TetR/AcrR family transcriptional regulator n=1 Tax=Paenibacillus flagellatus TaxID=2211139 RepID=UPI0013051C84|nr:helix-turn-helix domain-containing protein [Paenibacillus flagellatus]
MPRKIDDSEYIQPYDVKEHKFMTMEEEKRERVIESALKEFAKGYAAANTDVIVKESGISKGLIFHYFGSKRGLFLFLVKYASDLIMTEYETYISESRDFLDNIRIVSKQKADLSVRSPLLFGFLVKAQFAMKEVFPGGPPDDVPSSPLIGIEQVCRKSNNDKALFKEGIEREKALNIIMWTINGFIDSLFRHGDDLEEFRAQYDDRANELEAYLQMLRQILYR